MKKIYSTLVLLLFTYILSAQTVYYNKLKSNNCDNSSSITYETFDLTTFESQILAGNSPSDYTITYYDDNYSAQNNWTQYAIEIPTYYFSSFYYSTTNHVYARKHQNSNPNNYVIIDLCLGMYDNQNLNYPQNLVEYQTNNSGGIATFNLNKVKLNLDNQIANYIGNNLTVDQLILKYYLSEIDAINNQNEISNIYSFTNTIPNSQQIWYKVTSSNANACINNETPKSISLDVLTCGNDVVNISDIRIKNLILNINYNDNCNKVFAKDNQNNNIIIDANNDGLILQCEADRVVEFKIHIDFGEFNQQNFNIQFLNQFSNLKKLIVKRTESSFMPCPINSNYSYIDGTNLSGMQYLEEVSISVPVYPNSLNSTINLSNCPNLKKINLWDQYIYNSNTTHININNSNNLEELITNYYFQNNFNFSLYPSLKKIGVYNFSLPIADLSANVLLEDIKLDFTVNNNTGGTPYPIYHGLILPQTNTLQKLNIGKAILPVLNLQNYPNLTEVYLSSLSTEEITFSNCPSISKLDISNNKIKKINLTNQTQLTELKCDNNLIYQLDLSNQTMLNVLTCSNNPNLKFVNINNGSIESEYTYIPNPVLNYICADPSQVSAIQYNINANNLYNYMHVGSNCLNANNYVEINIPDANFKTKLIQLGIDTNNDSKIQLGEVSVLTSLDISSAGIQNIEGIQWFTNLTSLNCSSNSITVASYFNELPNLQNLNCSNNTISYLNVSKLINMQNLDFSNNSCVFIDLSKLVNLQTINASNNQLRQIYFNNGITETSINFSGNLKLHTITTDPNQNQYFTTLYPNATIDNLSIFNDYYIIIPDSYFYQAQKATPKSKALNYISYQVPVGSSDQRIDSYEGLQEFKNLETLDAITYWGSNSINNACVAQEYILELKHLEILNYTCASFIINDLSQLKKLKNFNIGAEFYNLNSTLNLNGCYDLQNVNLDCVCYSSSNPNIEKLNILVNNDSNETITIENNSIGNMNKLYICADDFQVSTLQTQFPQSNINTYCSFIPGGNYNTIQGTSVFDNELDGCDINDEVFEHLRLDLTNGTINASTFTDVQGNYKFYPNAGAFTMTPHLENPTYYNVSPTSVPVNFANNLNNITNQYFCITPNGVHNDVEVVLAQVTPARPGFDAEYSLVYKNKGNQPLSGAVSVTFEDDTLDFVNASTVPTSNTTGLLSWNYSNLLPFENRSITFTLNVNAPTETPAVNNGDVLAFNAAITPLAGDEIPADNTYTLNQTVVGSYDPNDIYCLEGESLDPSMIGNYLHYNVRFENTGTATAENIVVATNINSTDYDLSTLQVLNASHNVYTRMNGNLVEFIFENIQLAGSPAGGHGHVLFKMKSLNSLQTNDDVTSKAKIFFDYNFPIETNDATTIFETLNNQDFTKDETVKVYPNPANSIVHINSDAIIHSIELYDVQGRILQTVLENKNQAILDITNKSNGIYFVKVNTENGSKIEKMIKK